MTRPVEEVEDELSKIWHLVGELAEQNENNRILITQLKSRSDNVKGQAAHVGTGFPLRRFNLDISDEEFASELEAFSSHLVLENQQLQHENKQLNTLLKEYEQTLESVMGKFRGVAHASQQHDLSLHSYYTSLLQTLQTAHSSALLHDNTSLSLLLHRLSTLLRSALRALGGEDAEIDLDAHVPGLSAFTNLDSGRMILDSPPTSPARSASSNPKSIMRKPPQRPPVWHGSLPGASGGYIGTGGQGDWAMEREMEILRLEEENHALREVLKIAEETVEEVVEEPTEEVAAPESPEITGTASQRRKSSISVKELLMGAEHDQQEKSMKAKQAGGVPDVSRQPETDMKLTLPPKEIKGEVKSDAKEEVKAPMPSPSKTESALGLEAEPEPSGR